MKSIILAFIFLSALVVSGSALVANDNADSANKPNNPAINEKANACYTGGTLEGKCNNDLLWAAGWYLIRYEQGMISRADFPASLISALPAEIKQKFVASSGDSALQPDTACYIQVSATEYEYASPLVLNGGDKGDFYWSAGRLMNDFDGWTIWDNADWSVNFYGDCSPLGIGSPVPLDLNVIISDTP